MPYFPPVYRGQKFIPDVQLSNSVRSLLNTLNGYGAAPVLRVNSGRMLVQVYNATDQVLSGGFPVSFSAVGELAGGGALPAIPYEYTDAWGVLEHPLWPDQIGDALVLGTAWIPFTDPSFPYVEPLPGGWRGAASGAAVLSLGDEDGVGMSLVLVGGGAGRGCEYTGPFAVTLDENGLRVSAGWLTRNGDFLQVPDTVGIVPAGGILCLCTTLDDQGHWSTPYFQITAPAAAAYPIAEIAVSSEGMVSIRQFPVTVAVIILAKPCPLAEF